MAPPFAVKPDGAERVVASVDEVVASDDEDELSAAVSSSSVPHEIMVRLKSDIRITCKIFFILSSKSQEFISNLKSRLFIFWNQTL